MNARRIVPTLVLLMAGAAAARSHREHRKSPHQEIVAVVRVISAPRRTTHANGRSFEEFDVRIDSYSVDAAQPADAARGLRVDRERTVHVVHDLSCGGSWIEVAAGKKLEIRGEFVSTGGRTDVLHFTHPAGGACGDGMAHPDGFIRPTRIN